MARDQKTPVTFKLPDDQVSLITWEFVLDKLESALKEPLLSLELINQDLNRIDEKIASWAK